MTRNRIFTRRGKPVQLRELTDWIAVRLPPAETNPLAPASTRRASPAPASRRLTLSSRALDSIAPDVPLPQVRAFEDAGWIFVPRSAADSRYAGLPRAPIFLEPGGRLTLGAGTLVVQLRGDPSQAEAARLLRSFGCRVLEKLTFAPGLFRVAVTDRGDGDALDVAERLSCSDKVLSAEPELIETIGAR
jgi:hypothetical protein